jgi:5-methylcytosine-specific restriction protein A
MSELPKLLREIEETALRVVPRGFDLLPLPSTAEGDRFELVYQGAGWRAPITGVIGWRSLKVTYEPQGFGRSLVEHAESILIGEGREELLERSGILALGGEIEAKADGHSLSLHGTEDWPRNWRTFEITAVFSPIDGRTRDGAFKGGALIPRFESYLRLIVAFLPLEFQSDGPFVEDDLVGVEEGARARIEVNRYERDPRARAACIAARGTSCSVCEFSFETRYGLLGRGFVHVHHLRPLGIADGPMKVDPTRDLVPVCANCHAMLHRRSPPLSIEELQAQLRG